MSRRVLIFGQTLGLSLVVYPIALALHEVLHLVALHALGGQGALIVHGWRFTFLPITVNAFHAQPAQPLAFLPHLVFDFAGPALAALLLGVLTAAVHDRVARTALLANLAILGFYTLIEPLDVLLDAAGADLRFLLWAEFNYGVPLLIVLLAAGLAARPPRHQQRKAPRQAQEVVEGAPPRVLEAFQAEPLSGEGRA
jgi:hypothetical protein